MPEQNVSKRRRIVKKAEEKLTRSFSIGRFGIYNWDKFYKVDEDQIVRIEASFDLDEVTLDESIHIFLVTGEQRNVVIKYSQSGLQMFNFDASMYNQLVVVLGRMNWACLIMMILRN